MSAKTACNVAFMITVLKVKPVSQLSNDSDNNISNHELQ